LLPTSGASCANAPAENSNTAIIKIDFISVPYVPYVLNAASSLKANCMPKIPFQPCLPTRGTKVPAGPDWIPRNKV
jgi:hypothetical protein